MVGYTGARSPKNGQREERDSYGKQHRKAGEKYKKKIQTFVRHQSVGFQRKEYIDVELITTRSY